MSINNETAGWGENRMRERITSTLVRHTLDLMKCRVQGLEY